MSADNYTTPPWSVLAGTTEDVSFVVVAHDAWPRVALIAHRASTELELANARLIAAAPDLLALARQYASECGECNGRGLIEVTVERTVPACCGRPNNDGSCCGNAVPELVPDVEQAPCPDCEGIRAVIAKAVGP